MKRLLAIVLLLIPSLAYAGLGTQYSGITTMTFQNGVSPTADYAGCEDTYICSATADTGLNMGSADSLRVSSAGNTSVFKSKQNRTLIKFDISALPDSAIITQAYLYLYQNLGATGTGYTDSLFAFRLFKSWTEGTGTNNGTAQAASADWNNRTGLVWSAAGATATSTAPTASSWGTGGTPPSFNAGSTDSALVPTSWTGADTVWSSATLDIHRDPLALTRLNTGVGQLKWGWVVFNIADQVRRWHIGANRNDGLLLAVHFGQTGPAKVFAFYSSEFADKPYRPKLVVQYFDPQTAGSSGSGTGGTGKRIVGDGRAPKQ